VTSVLSARCNKCSPYDFSEDYCFSDLSPKRALQRSVIFVTLVFFSFSDLSPKRALQLIYRAGRRA